MIPDTDLTPEAERTALEDLVKSDGWAIVKRLVDQQFGASAQLRDIDAVMSDLKPGDDERAVVTQIRAAGKAAHTVIDLAESRLRQLSTKKSPLAGTPFAAFRRAPRTGGVPNSPATW